MTFTPDLALAKIQSTGIISGKAAAITASGKPAAPSTSGNTINPASGIPAIPAPAMIEEITMTICLEKGRSIPIACAKNSAAIAS